MAVTVSVYRDAKDYICRGSINLATSTSIRALLVNSGYTFVATHKFLDNVVANDIVDQEVTTNGGSRLANGSVVNALSFSGNNVLFDTTDLDWTASGGTLDANGIVIYDDVGGVDTARRSLFHVDFGVTLSAGDTTHLKLLTPSGLVLVS